MNTDIINKFLNFYYCSINSHLIENIKPHVRDASCFIRNKKQFKGVSNIINHLNECKNNIFMPIDTDILLNGERRANIMVYGSINDIPFVEYIHFAYGNDKQYWIHSSILKIFNP
jgi:hypothetical protein